MSHLNTSAVVVGLWATIGLYAGSVAAAETETETETPPSEPAAAATAAGEAQADTPDAAASDAAEGTTGAPLLEESAQAEPAAEPAHETVTVPQEPSPATGSGIAGADATVQTAPGTPAPPPPGYDTMNLPPRPRKGLMIAGWGVFGGMYVLSALVGLTMLGPDATDPGERCTNCEDVGPKLLIPLVGPFLAIPGADGADGKVVTSLLGTFQIAGLALAIVGTVRYAMKKRAYMDALNSSAALPRMRFDYTRRNGGSLNLSWSF